MVKVIILGQLLLWNTYQIMKKFSFDAIQNDIYYLLDKGSYVEDYIGQGKDQFGNEYNLILLMKLINFI